jgi:hypothetical protein
VDDDKVMEALFREIVTSPCTAQYETVESRKVPFTGSSSAAEITPRTGDETGSGLVFVGMGDRFIRAKQMQAREGKEVEDYTDFADGESVIRDYSAGEGKDEMERMLDEMIGLVDGEIEIGLPYTTSEYFDIGAGLGLSMDLDMATLSGWDIDAAMGCIGAH